MAKVILRKGEGRLLKRGGLWIFDNEIDATQGEFTNGDLVRVYDFDKYPLGVGVINTNSKIRVRVLSRNAEEEINDSFFEKRVRDAVEYRIHTVDTACCRLIFGEADFLPGIVVDKYADILVIQSLSLGMDRFKETILKLLVKVLSDYQMPIRGIYERSDAKERLKEGMEIRTGFIGEEFDPKVEIVENGVHYMVDVENGQKTGFFLDQKYNRLAIQKLCKDARVLDCFTHTGSFALNAGIGGAREVLGVDVSETGIAQARENACLNHLEDIVKFQCADVFDLLPELEEQKEEFDVVILDPPAFTKSRASVKNATKGYREINIRGMRLVKDRGYFVTCSCSHFMTYELFTQTIAQAAGAAHVRLRQVEFREQSPDHPILWAAEESYYLKFYIFQVIRER